MSPSCSGLEVDEARYHMVAIQPAMHAIETEDR